MDSRQSTQNSQDGSASPPSEPRLLPHVDLPPLPSNPPHPFSELNEKQLRSALIGACKRMPRNAEAHFHLGLMYMRKCDGEEALRAFQHCKQIYNERLEHYKAQNLQPPAQLLSNLARLRSHTAQAAHLAASERYRREERAPFLSRLQNDLVQATKLDAVAPDVWNALALMHLTEEGYKGAQEVLKAIRRKTPEYMDALNNLGLAELALGNESEAVRCFQKVILVDKEHPEALSNYGLVLLRLGIYDGAIRAFESAVESAEQGRGLAFAWGGLAVARGAIGMLEEAELAAEEAERSADAPSKPRFSMLLTSMRARRVTAELRRGLSSSEPVRENGEDPRPAMDAAVLKLRALSRDLRTGPAVAALGAVLRLRHEYSWEENGNRNFGAEAAERLVEALEIEDTDSAAWVQLALLQMATGEYAAARGFAVQGISRDAELEGAWNAMAVASQLNDDIAESERAYRKAIEIIKKKYCKRQRTGEDDGEDGENRGDGLNAPVGLDRVKEEQERDEYEEDNRPSAEQQASSAMEEAKLLEPESVLLDLNEAGLAALAALYNNYGNHKRQEGKSFSHALAAFNTSLKLGGENAIVYNNLALLYVSVGRLNDANDMLEHALKLEPRLECAVSNSLKLKALQRQLDREKREKEDSSNFDELEDSL